ncbi:MAG: SGNH/GDSL hydrolase family protein [Hyphomicrobium sp.]
MTHFRKSFLFPVISILIGIAVALSVVEIILRIFRLSPTQGVQSVNQELFETLPGAYMPSQRIVARHVPTLPHKVTINSLGYRGADFPAEKPPGELRVFMTGDSFTYGDVVDDDKTLPFQLEVLLEGRCAKVRVINAGLAGSTVDAQSALIERAVRVKPDIVILMFHENDVIDLNASLWKELEINRQIRSSFPMSVVFSLLHSTATYHLARRAEKQVRDLLRKETMASDASREDELDRRERMKLVYSGELRSVYERLQERSVDFIFAMFPNYLHVGPPKPNPASKPGEVSWYDREMVEWAETTAKGMGIPTLNLQDVLYRGLARVEDGYLLPHDGHPSPKGYQVAAEAFARFPPLVDSISRNCAPSK